MAFSTAPVELKETLATDQFITALTESDIRIRIKQAHPKDLNEAIPLAVELDANNKAEKQSAVRIASKEQTLDQFRDLLSDLSKKVDSLQKKQYTPKRENKPQQRTCYYCKKPGHFKRNCIKYKRDKERNKERQHGS
ncbi:hypothetical protein FSP39_014708 [Pinctada imbricata]|uniref:CCHC-type domain-containing protein n=1 Tax=Pinctada imbricata TaxID=66713 RepID=A0AA88XFI0_PINIB|nr:hypothetical protein FSP39_014708 [Pinctada imbricata]